MTDHDDQTNDPAAEAPEERGRDWRGTVQFVGVFVVAVLSLLIGYRLLVLDTPVNDWYLFHVAKHTAWTLSWIGHEADLESIYRDRYDPREIRAVIAKGSLDPTPEELAAASDAPVTAWEAYQYRALRSRAEDTGASYGPHVGFVLYPGLHMELADARRALGKVEAEGADTTAAASAVAELEARVQALSEEAASADPEQAEAARAQLRATSFPFIVVPECGAIEVMAIFFAAVIALPTVWWKKAVGLGVGLPIMYAVNVFRLTCLGIIGALDDGGDIFNFVHEYIWQSVYIVFVVVVWLAWIELLVKRKEAE